MSGMENGSRAGRFGVKKIKVVIETENLSKYYGKDNEIRALDKLNLNVFEGETFGLLGPNGAGKTTAVRLLNGIIKPSGGTARVNGFDIFQQVDDVKRVTGMLAESFGFYDKLSAEEFLEFMGAIYDVPGNVLKGRIDELLKLFGLHERRNHLIEGYSSGMKQKLLIAAALIHDPPILFFDEPTSTLDPSAAHMVKELIQQLADTAGKTIFMCSHLLTVVEELCDRIGIINKGRLIAVGTIDEIIAQSGTRTLEEAFIALTGGLVNSELLAWRDQVAQP